MTESSLNEKGGDGIPAWMEAVNEDTLYSAAPPGEPEEQVDEPTSPDSATDVSATMRRPEEPSTNGGDHSLGEMLSLSLGQPTNVPQPDPDLQPTNVGQVRADLNRHLEKAVQVLNTRYGPDFSKSLVLEFALRETLLDLQNRDENSNLVQWLDSILPRS